MSVLTREQYLGILEARLRAPEDLRSALLNRTRRPILGADGNLLMVAADHTARGMLAVDGDPLAVADRFSLLSRLKEALDMPEVDGVLASADVLEELAYIGALDRKLAIGTMNRGGIIGASWELDDRMTAYDPERIAAYGLDGGKLLLRIEDTDSGVASTLEWAGSVTSRLADHKIMCLLEPLPYLKDASGRAYLDQSTERLVKVVAIASGLGASSAYSWLKIPASPDMKIVAAATTMPILMLGGDPGDKTEEVFDLWKRAMDEPNVRGLVVGRALLYPRGNDIPKAVKTAAHFVHMEEGV